LSAQSATNPIGRRIRGEVDITGLPAEEGIPNGPADQGKLKTGRGEQLAELIGEQRGGRGQRI
jgi:hypothetical protein